MNHGQEAAPEEKDEIKEFVFDTNNYIDVDALENFVQSNKDDLINSEEGLEIDLSKMMINRKDAISAKRNNEIT